MNIIYICKFDHLTELKAIETHSVNNAAILFAEEQFVSGKLDTKNLDYLKVIVQTDKNQVFEVCLKVAKIFVNFKAIKTELKKGAL